MTEISRRQFAAYAVAVVLVVLLGGRALRADATPTDGAAASPGAFAPGGGSAAPGTGATGAGGSATTAPGVEVGAVTERLLVHVAGAVHHPGVYVLRPGARVQ